MEKYYDVAIIGSGPAGYTAALYASRAFLKTIVLSGIQPGGQLTTTTHVDNYPGFPQGVLGPKLVTDMKAQVERFGAEVRQAEASRITKDGETFRIETSGKVITSRTVIIATGAAAKYLGLPSEETFRGKGVSACATCDGFFFKGKDVIVVGGGDTAMEEATFLTKFASKVTIVHRREEFRASAIMLDRAKKDKKIAFVMNATVEEILGDDSVNAVVVKDTKTGEIRTLRTQGVFLAIGHTPNTNFLKDFLTLDQKGYVIVKRPDSPLEPQMETEVPGVYAAGDCVDSRYRQAIVAAGQGCMAAMDAEKYLEEHGAEDTA